MPTGAEMATHAPRAQERTTASRLWSWFGRKRWWAFLALILVAGLMAIFVLPSVLVRPHGPISEADRLKAQNDVRGTLIQALGGVVLFAGLYVTWRTFDLNREGQVTERFTRAIDQLGSEHADVRTGGIYALERIARDSERDYGPIVEILVAYVRSRAPWPPLEADKPLAPGEKRRPATDVQAAMRVLGRRDPNRDEKGLEIRLSDVDLRGANLRGGRFDGVRLRRSNLEDARLEGVHFEHAELGSANLQEAHLAPDSDLDLPAANLSGATLEGTRFDDANLAGVNLKGAIYNEKTRWPAGFDPKSMGAIESTKHKKDDPPEENEA